MGEVKGYQAAPLNVGVGACVKETSIKITDLLQCQSERLDSLITTVDVLTEKLRDVLPSDFIIAGPKQLDELAKDQSGLSNISKTAILHNNIILAISNRLAIIINSIEL